MELMTSLLLCVLATLPQALGKSSQRNLDLNVRYNTSTNTHNIDPLKKTKIILNTNGMNMHGDLQAIFVDQYCLTCNSCMERAIKAIKSQSNNMNDILENYGNQRHKRAANSTETKLELETKIKTKKSKAKKSKVHKSVTVTKYNIDGEVYALKVKETNTPLTTDVTENNVPMTTCLVYQVKKSFTCESPEGDLILTVAKRKVNKKGKKDKERQKIPTTTTTTERVMMTAPVFKKRHVDNSQVPENFMPSIEELY